MNNINSLTMPWTRTTPMDKDRQLEVTRLAPVKMMGMASNTAANQWLRISFHLDLYRAALVPIMAVASFNNLDLKANFQVVHITKWTMLEVASTGRTTRITTSEIQSTPITISSIMLKILMPSPIQQLSKEETALDSLQVQLPTQLHRYWVKPIILWIFLINYLMINCKSKSKSWSRMVRDISQKIEMSRSCTSTWNKYWRSI